MCDNKCDDKCHKKCCNAKPAQDMMFSTTLDNLEPYIPIQNNITENRSIIFNQKVYDDAISFGKYICIKNKGKYVMKFIGNFLTQGTLPAEGTLPTQLPTIVVMMVVNRQRVISFTQETVPIPPTFGATVEVYNIVELEKVAELNDGDRVEVFAYVNYTLGWNTSTYLLSGLAPNVTVFSPDSFTGPGSPVYYTPLLNIYKVCDKCNTARFNSLQELINNEFNTPYNGNLYPQTIL